MTSKICIISGVTGQTGSYLAEELLARGFQVIGFSRRTAVHSTQRIDHLLDNEQFEYLEGDVTDAGFITRLIAEKGPYAYYNMAAQSHVHASFESPVSTTEMDLIGVLNALEAIRTLSPHTKFYQASTSGMFGSSFDEIIESDRCVKYQDESTEMVPQSPYAVAKLAAHHMVRLYREAYGLYACSGIMFNNESPRRGENFVTQKIALWVQRFNKWRNGERVLSDRDDVLSLAVCPSETFPKLRLGNIDAYRDWAHSRDTARAIVLMLEQEDVPEDLVIGTGETHSVREFLRIALGEDYEDYIVIDPKFFRPAEVPYLRSNPARAKSKLNWKPQIGFPELVKEMCHT
jgi:GDPmannose 4,6-dehydratase